MTEDEYSVMELVAIKSFNPAFGLIQVISLMGVDVVEGDMAISDKVHTYLYSKVKELGSKVATEDNQWYATINPACTTHESLGPNHNGYYIKDILHHTDYNEQEEEEESTPCFYNKIKDLFR